MRVWLLFLSLSSAIAGNDYGLCCLCNECYPSVAGRGSMTVTTAGLTCDDVALTMADPTKYPANSDQCRSMKRQYRRTCCKAKYEPIPVMAVPAPPKIPNLKPGQEPWCDLCPDGTYPGRPNTVTAVLYIPGNPTCHELYW